MAIIFITGDTHGGYKSGETKLKEFAKKYRFGKDDYLIIAGDFGFIWEDETDKKEKEWLDWFDNQKFTTLFIDGNHENFNRLDSYKFSYFCGGMVHKISKKVIHLLRGEIYEINGLRIFTMGGALSVDKYRRTLNVSWWKGEGITQEQISKAWEKLRQIGYKVDIAITHTCPRSVIKKVINPRSSSKLEDINMDILQGLCGYIKFRKWYFGHFHINRKINSKFSCLYDDIEKINLKPVRDFSEEKANLPDYIIKVIENLHNYPNSYYDCLKIIGEAREKGDISDDMSYELKRNYLGLGF